MIKSILFGKWSGHANWCVSKRWEWFYRAKALICSVLNREPSRDADVYEHVHLTYTDGGVYGSDSSPTIHWFEAIVVGYGVFRNWWVTYYQDSD